MPVRPKLSRGWARLRAVPRPLAALLALSLALGVGWTAAAAPLTGPDELSHYPYVQALAETGDGPSRDGGEHPQSSQVGHLVSSTGLSPIIGRIEGRPLFDRIEQAEREAATLPADDGTGPNPAGTYPPLYYAYGAVAYHLSPDRSPLGRITAVRLAGVLLYVLIVALAWLVAAELFTRTWPRVVAAGMVALQPKLAYLSTVVSPDIAIVAETTALLWLALRMVRLGPTPRRALAVAAVAGLGALTGPRGFALAPAAVIALAIALAVHRPSLRATLRSLVPAGAALAVAGIGALLYSRAHSGGGAFAGQASVASGFNTRQLLSQVWQFYFPKLASMEPRLGPGYGYRQVYIETFFGQFGSLEIAFDKARYDALQVLAALGLAGLWTAAVARWQRVRAFWPQVAVCAGTLASLLVLLHVVSYNSLRTGPDPVITGRYLLACIVLYGVAIAFVCSSLGRRAGQILGGALLGGSALLMLGGLGLTLERFHG